jgi:hypothetical protein
MDRFESSASVNAGQIVMRQATEKDLDFLAGCYVKVACHMKAGEQDFYIARLPETPDETIRNHVARCVGREDALTLLEESKVCLWLACWPVSAAPRSLPRVWVSRVTLQCVGSSQQTGAAASRPSWSAPPKIGFGKRKSVSSSFRIWSRTNSPRFHGSASAINPSEFSPTRNFRHCGFALSPNWVSSASLLKTIES